MLAVYSENLTKTINTSVGENQIHFMLKQVVHIVVTMF